MSSTRKTNVPWDVFTDIFSRLSVKSLLRFSSVTKSFYALFKDPGFISRHLHMSSNISSRLLVHMNFALASGHSLSLLNLKTLNFTDEPHFLSPRSDGRVVLVSSYNGIVSLLCDQGPYIILWSPSIKEHIILPEPALPYSLRLTGFKTNFNSIGFGFHNGEYKVVRIASESIHEVHLGKIEIYSTASSLLREIDSNLPRKIYDLTCSVIIKGNPYWIEYESDELQRCIVAFVGSSELFEAINLPWWNNNWKTCGDGTVDDHLAVYIQSDYRDEDEKWTKLFVIRNLPVPGWPLGMYDNGLFIWIKSENYLRSYSRSRIDLVVYSPLTDKEVKRIECLNDLENLKA